MQWYHLTLLMMAAIACVTAWKVPNAVAWVLTGVCFAIMTSLAHQNEATLALAFGAITNLIMCFLIYSFAQKLWETRLMQTFILMLEIDFLYAVGIIKTQYVFAVSLEIVNAYALLLVFTAGVLDWVAKYGGVHSNRYSRMLGNFHTSLFSDPAAYPKWWKHR